MAGGEPRLVVTGDDSALKVAASDARLMSIGPDRLYLTVSEYESDIWVMNLKY